MEKISREALEIIVRFRLRANGQVNYDYLSPKCEQITGYGTAELQANPDLWVSMVNPQDWQDVILPVMAHILAGQEEIGGIEYRIRDRWGNVRWLRGSLVAQPMGTEWMITAVFTELTAATSRSQERIDNEERLSLALEAARIGYWDWDLSTNRVAWSPRLVQIMGLSAVGFDGRIETVMALIHPEDLPSVRAGIRASLEDNQPYACEFRFLKPDGQIRWAASHGVVHRDPTGRPLRMVGVDMDITDRKLMEENLRRQESLFRTLVEQTPDGILRCNPQHQFLYVNPSVEHKTGLNREQFLGKTPTELGFPLDLIQSWQTAIDLAFETGQEQFLETREETTAGHEILFSRIVPERDPQGKVESVLILSREVTDLYRAQEMLLLQAERERILNQITHNIRQSLDVKVVLNQAVQEVKSILQADRVVIYRFRPDWSGDMVAEAVGSPWTPLLQSHLHNPCFIGDLVTQYRLGKINRIPDIEKADVVPCHLNLLRGLEVRANLAVPIVKDETLWALFCVHHCQGPHEWQDWEVELVQQIAVQLSLAVHHAELYQQTQSLAATLERQVAERTATLEQSLRFEATLRRISDQVRDSLDEDHILETAVTELGQTLQLQYCDTGIYSPDKSTSTITHEYVHQGSSKARGVSFAITAATHPETYPQVFAGITFQFCDLLSYSFRDDQSHKTVLVCPLQDNLGGMGTIFGDMWLVKPTSEAFSPSEVRLAEQVANQCAIAIRQARLYQASQAQVERLAELNRLKEEFIHTVSHELRTPLTSMKMALTMLQATQNQPEKQQRYWQILQKEWQRELTLVNELLELQALESGTRVLDPREIELIPWLQSLLEPFYLRCQERHQDLQVTWTDDRQPLIIDANLLERVILELLNNACKYTPPHHIIRVNVLRDPSAVRFEICNTGVMLTEEQLHNLFTKFYRLPHLDVFNQGGTGLGLALAHKAAVTLGGSLVATRIEQGVAFVMTVPLGGGGFGG